MTILSPFSLGQVRKSYFHVIMADMATPMCVIAEVMIIPKRKEWGADPYYQTTVRRCDSLLRETWPEAIIRMTGKVLKPDQTHAKKLRRHFTCIPEIKN